MHLFSERIETPATLPSVHYTGAGMKIKDAYNF